MTTRSARGAGSLQQLAPGRWRSQGIDPTGRRRSAIHHVGTKREAVEAHTRFMVRIGAGQCPACGQHLTHAVPWT